MFLTNSFYFLGFILPSVFLVEWLGGSPSFYLDVCNTNFLLKETESKADDVFRTSPLISRNMYNQLYLNSISVDYNTIIFDLVLS